MRKTNLLLTAVLMSLFLSCGQKSDTETKTVTLTDDESGAKINATVNQKELPKDFPDDIYVIKGTIGQISTVNIGDQKTVSLYLNVDMSLKEARADILKNMEAKGWKTEMNMGSQQYYTKDKKTVRIATQKDDDKNSVVYMVTY